MAAEYEVNIKINSREIERELGNIDKAVAKIGKPRGGGGRRKKAGIAGLLPSSEELKASERGIIQLIDRFEQRKQRAIARSNAANEKALKLNKQLVAEARKRVRLFGDGFDGSRPQGRQLSNDINARAKAQDKRAKLLNKINEMEAKGLNVSKLRKRLAKGTTEQANRQFASAQQHFRLLQKTIELEQSKLRILKEQQKGFPASPIRGTATMMGSPAQIAASGRQAADPIKGRADLVGSPAYYEAQQKAIDRLGRQGGPSDPVKGHANLVGSPKYFEEQQKAIDKAARQGGARSPIRGSKDLIGSPAYYEAQQKAIDRLARQGGARSPIRGNKDLIGSPAYYEHQRKQLEKLARKGGPSSPIGGGANMPGSPIARRRGMKRLGDTALGAGFPLLFGGGPGAVLGGAVGGAFGGGLAAQIGLSAIGQQIDQFIGGAISSAESLGSVGTALDFLREKSLFSSKESEQLAKKLENQGDLTGIAALVTDELNKALGPGGIQKMQDLAEQTKLAKEQWGQLTTNLELLIAGPLAEFLKIVNATLGIKVAQSQFARALETLKEKDPQRLRELLPSFEGSKSKNRLAEIGSNLTYGPNMAGGIFNMQGVPEVALLSFTEQMNEIIKNMGTPDGVIPITEQDRDRFKGNKAAKEAEQLARRLANLDAERSKLEQLLKLDEKLNAAKLEGNQRQVIKLENEARLLEFAEKEAQIKASSAKQEVKASELKNLSLEKDRALLENAFRLNSFDKENLDNFEFKIDQLDLQLKAATAISDEAERQAKLELLLLRLGKDRKNLTDEQFKELKNKTKQLFDAQNKGPLQSFIDKSTKSLNNLQQHAVQVSQGIGNAIGNSLTSGIQNLISGAKNVKEVFADMLKSIADVLFKYAAEMIATYIALGIARAFAMGGMAADWSGGTTAADPTKGLLMTTMLAEGGYLSGGFRQFDEGGAVNKPTLGLVGEGGEPEYIIPESKMRESMNRYSRGARGSAVIPAEGGVSSIESESGAISTGAIDVRYTVERINNVDYVTADQFQQGMQRAAAEGAARGEQQTLRKLQMSGSTRRRLGM